eukprot:3092414-Karenia_brevis.AAC.1
MHPHEVLLSALLLGLPAQPLELGVHFLRLDFAAEQAHKDVRPWRRPVREEPGREGLHYQDGLLGLHAGS